MQHLGTQRVHSRSAVGRALLLVVILALTSGCGGASSESALDWLMGAESQFTARIDGAVTDSLRGTADFRTDDRGRLVGIELNRTDAPMDGLSLELQPHPAEADTYIVIEPALMGAAREGQPPGFVAYLESDAGSFQAADGTLEISEMSNDHIEGTFDLYMQGARSSDPSIEIDITVTGSFEATRPGQ